MGLFNLIKKAAHIPIEGKIIEVKQVTFNAWLKSIPIFWKNNTQYTLIRILTTDTKEHRGFVFGHTSKYGTGMRISANIRRISVGPYVYHSRLETSIHPGQLLTFDIGGTTWKELKDIRIL